MIYSEDHYNALEQKAVNHILARDTKIEQQADRIKELEATLSSAGEWIVGAEIAVEPGWEGSQSHILRRIETALDGGDA